MQKLRNPPIVEAVVDFNCELSPSFNFRDIKQEPAHKVFASTYPTVRTVYTQQHTIPIAPGEQAGPAASSEVAIQAYQFLGYEGRQIVQVRAEGFSFNRLAPYSSFDDYLPEVERTWKLYVNLIPVVRIETIQLRYINRLMLPMAQQKVELEEFLKIGPRSPDEDRLTLSGFTTQLSAVENDTKEQLNLILVAEAATKDHLPVILDIAVRSQKQAAPGDWALIESTLMSLRRLKNRVFENTVTPKCIELYR